MYNEVQKSRFAEILKEEDSGSLNLYMTWVFSKTEKYETELNKDVCNFTTENIIYMYKMFNLNNINTMNTLNNLLSKYVKWAIQEGLVKTNQNNFRMISIDIMMSCLNTAVLDKKIISKEEVFDLIKPSLNPRTQFVMLALFEFNRGEAFKDIGLLKLEDIDFDNHMANLPSGRTVHISEELEDLAVRSSEEEFYYSEMYITTEIFDGDVTRKNKLINNGTIIKSINKLVTDHQKISRNTYRIIHTFLKDSYLSVSDIINSGKIHYIKEGMRKANITSVEDYLMNADIRKDIQNQFGCSPIIVKRFLAKYGDLF